MSSNSSRLGTFAGVFTPSILTILGVTAISVAQMDMKIAQNLRHHRQLVYGALALGWRGSHRHWPHSLSCSLGVDAPLGK